MHATFKWIALSSGLFLWHSSNQITVDSDG